MKHYMDIENLKETEELIGTIIRPSNTSAFDIGDHIQITEKYDGSNASIENVNDEIKCFSRKQELSYNNTLNGFYTYIQNKVDTLVVPENYVVFGEWSGAKNKIVYDKKNEWFVFDIYNKETEKYLPQVEVMQFCLNNNLQYIHELYNGPFISWEHCRTFLHSPAYGERQEGIVIKNQDKLSDSRDYFYLKIVNEDFKERMKQKPPKELDLEKLAEQEKARVLMETIVTRARVEKMIFKLRDEGVIGDTLSNKDMSVIAKNLPQRIYADCVKEENETIIAAGEYAGKLCNNITMKIARQIIIGE